MFCKILLTLLLLVATPCWAQSDEKLFLAGKLMEMVAPSLAQAVIAVDLCGVGNAEPWKRAVAAIDRRQARCVAEQAGWKKLTEKSDVPAGTSAFDAFLATRGAEARAQGAAAYCGRVPWKLVLVPGAATDAAKEDFRRERPDVPRAALDEFVSWMGWVRALGDDTRWVDAPCKDVWPEPSK